MAVVRLAKLKTCRVCPTQFRPMSSTQVVCSPGCAQEYVRRREERKAQREAREEKRERRARLKELEPRRKVLARAQSAFNAFIRERDRDRPCISCGVVNPPERFGGAWDCGHYRSVGAAPELRFEELNAHKQCKACNGGSGRFARKGETVRMQYRERLIERIGREAVHWLEGQHPPKHYTVEELEAIAKKYRAKARELRRARGA